MGCSLHAKECLLAAREHVGLLVKNEPEPPSELAAPVVRSPALGCRVQPS